MDSCVASIFNPTTDVGRWAAGVSRGSRVRSRGLQFFGPDSRTVPRRADRSCQGDGSDWPTVAVDCDWEEEEEEEEQVGALPSTSERFHPSERRFRSGDVKIHPRDAFAIKFQKVSHTWCCLYLFFFIIIVILVKEKLQQTYRAQKRTVTIGTKNMLY